MKKHLMHIGIIFGSAVVGAVGSYYGAIIAKESYYKIQDIKKIIKTRHKEKQPKPVYFYDKTKERKA